MKVPFIDLKAQYAAIKSDVDFAIQKVFDGGYFIGGEPVIRFEKELSNYYNVRHCVGVANGYDALFIILKMLGVGEGDEVITTVYSWVATANAISQTGAKPVFVDVREDFNIDVRQIKSRITPRTKAILPVHLYGQACDMDEIMKMGLYHKIFILEDAAQGHGGIYKRKKLGSIGNAGILSFYPTKQMGAYGDAGCILTNDDDLMKKCREFSNHGVSGKIRFTQEGINSRMDTLQAAILTEKLKNLDTWIGRRNEIAATYYDQLKDVKGIQLSENNETGRHAYYNFPILVDDRDKFIFYLHEHNIEVGKNYHFILSRITPYHDQEEYPVASTIASRVLTLPIYPEMTSEQVLYVCDAIKQFFH